MFLSFYLCFYFLRNTTSKYFIPTSRSNNFTTLSIVGYSSLTRGRTTEKQTNCTLQRCIKKKGGDEHKESGNLKKEKKRQKKIKEEKRHWTTGELKRNRNKSQVKKTVCSVRCIQKKSLYIHKYSCIQMFSTYVCVIRVSM